MKSVLVLGGTGFIGRHFSEALTNRRGIRVSLANRGNESALFPSFEQIVIDRDNLSSCQAELGHREWDYVFDFSGTSYQRLLHTAATVSAGHYTFLSTSAVDLALPDDPFLPMAQEKLWCEHIVGKGFDTLAVRAAFVVGKYDNTNRFEERHGDWCWRGTDRAVRPAIEANHLVHSMLTLAFSGHCGVVKAGYSEPV